MRTTKAQPDAGRFSPDQEIIASDLDGRALGGEKIHIGFKGGKILDSSTFSFTINVTGHDPSSSKKTYLISAKLDPEAGSSEIKALHIQLSEKGPEDSFYNSLRECTVRGSHWNPLYREIAKGVLGYSSKVIEKLGAMTSIMWKMECDSDSGDPKIRGLLFNILNTVREAQNYRAPTPRR